MARWLLVILIYLIALPPTGTALAGSERTEGLVLHQARTSSEDDEAPNEEEREEEDRRSSDDAPGHEEEEESDEETERDEEEDRRSSHDAPGNEEEDEEDRRSSDDAPGHEEEEESDEEPEHDEEEDEEEHYDEDYAYYGQVQVTRPVVVVGDRRLVGDLPLFDFLAPGMRVEVEGRVEDGRIRVRELHVLFPRTWAYYEGPGPEGWTRIWFVNGRAWRVQAANESPRVRLLACFEKKGWRGLPDELAPGLRPPRSGLWLLEGLLLADRVHWTRQQRLGACGRAHETR